MRRISPARHAALLALLLSAGLPAGAQQLVVVDIESRVPVRDVLAYTDDGQEARSAWDGAFALRPGYGRIGFRHPNYEPRYVLRSELRADTVCLIPKMNALREVVVYGRQRDLTALTRSKPSPLELRLVATHPEGFSPLGLIGLVVDKLWGKRYRHRAELRKEKYRQMMDNY